MKNIVLTLASLFFITLSYAQDNLKEIKGKITHFDVPVVGADITVSGSDQIFKSELDGIYKVQASEGDIITFSYPGLKNLEVLVEDVTRILNISMWPKVNELDEVIVEASRRRSQNDMEEDYPINKNIIKTAYGYVDGERSAGNVRFLYESQINAVSFCIIDLLRGKFGGVTVVGDCTFGGAVFIRGVSSLFNNRPAVFDIDGQVFEDAPLWLNTDNIKRLAIFSNFGMTARYGNLGAGGVVVINTINGNPALNKIVDRARLKNNFADGKELSKVAVAQNDPEYLKEFRNSDSFETSKTIFKKYLSAYANSPYFLLDAYTHFAEIHKNLTFADEIIDAHFGRYSDNPVLLKALAYTYESQQRIEKANEVYKEVFILRPNYAQSYLDMANSYRNLRGSKKAASMYARYEYLIEEGFMEQDTLGFGPIMDREYNNLLMLKKAELVDDRKAKKLFIAEEYFEGTRLVFEWNDGEADFELQFVNPGEQYYTWKHSLLDNADEIAREKNFGYNLTEYLVDNALPGTWKVNVNYLGNKSLTPTYLKASIYSNYGTALQQKEVKVFKLALKSVNQQLFTIKAASKVVSR